MPTLNELAKSYAEYIKTHVSSPTVENDVTNKIKGLTYTTTGEPLSSPDIDKLVNELEIQLSPSYNFSEEVRLVEAESSTDFIKMVQNIRKGAKSR